MSHKVGLLMGGKTSEREVSLNTSEACKTALSQLGHDVFEIDVDENLINILRDLDVDVCFNALHGGIGENGSIQGLLNLINLPYTHSGVRASSIAMDKPTAKSFLSKSGILFPEKIQLKLGKYISARNYKGQFVIKPRSEGSSIGIKIIRDNNSKIPKNFWPNPEDLMSEKYISGKELTVGVLDGRALCVTEIIPEKDNFYDYNSKYELGGSKHILPAEIPAKIKEKAIKWSEKAFKELDCRGIIRADYRYDEINSNLYMLEINTQPGMTKTSLIPEQAYFCGISFNELISKILEKARCD